MGEQGKDRQQDKWFYLAIILLGMFFLFKLINQSQIMWQFPLDQNNDISSHIGQLHFLKQYGFHNIVQNWYNGYSLFLNYPILWYYLTLPIYLLFNNILAAAFVSHILLYIIGFFFFLAIGKIAKISFAKTSFFYLVFYANPVAIGNFIKLGRMTELTGMTIFIAFFVLLLYLKEKPLGIKAFFAFIILYSAIILAHPSWMIFASLMIPSFFLLKRKRESFAIILAILLSLLITAFWLYPFAATSGSSWLKTFQGTARLVTFSKDLLFDNLMSFVIPPFMWLAAFFYFRNIGKTEGRKQLKEEIIFYSVPLIASFLYITRLIIFVPILNRPYPDTYHMLFMLFAFFFLVKTPIDSYSKSFRNLIKTALILLPFIFILSSAAVIPNFRQNNGIDKEVISLLPGISMNDKFLVEKMPYPTSSLALYSYAAIYYNLSTPSGWAIPSADAEYFGMLASVGRYMDEKNCANLSHNP